jgi:uncharacterized protein (DUF488 family)
VRNATLYLVKEKLFTIGHSTHPIERFVELLRAHSIQAVADVRSQPFSRWVPQFNRDRLEKSLKDAAIQYVFLGDELGARRAEPEVYLDGVARYDRIAQTAAFIEGLNRIRNGLQQFRLALVCREKDPLECHRTILVCRHLRDEAEIAHIRPDGSLESHADAEARLLKEEKIATTDLFANHLTPIKTAYDSRAEKIAYRTPKK